MSILIFNRCFNVFRNIDHFNSSPTMTEIWSWVLVLVLGVGWLVSAHSVSKTRQWTRTRVRRLHICGLHILQTAVMQIHILGIVILWKMLWRPYESSHTIPMRRLCCVRPMVTCGRTQSRRVGAAPVLQKLNGIPSRWFWLLQNDIHWSQLHSSLQLSLIVWLQKDRTSYEFFVFTPRP